MAPAPLDAGEGHDTGAAMEGGASSDAGAALCGSVTLSAAPFTPKRTVTVCASGCDYTTPSAAVAAAQDYDRIQVHAGDYVDCASVPAAAAHLWLQGVGGGMVHMHDQVCEDKGVIVSSAALLVVDNFEFSGMVISCDLGQNAVGIRVDAGDVWVRNDYFHDGQGGILTDNTKMEHLTILNSHFARLGLDETTCASDMLNWFHDIYIGIEASLDVCNSLFEQNPTGNVLKTRAYESTLQCNQIVNGYDATYAKNGFLVDLPNGGEEHLLHNLIAQGTFNGGQQTMAEFGDEIGGQPANPTQSLDVTDNVFLNDVGSGTIFLVAHPAAPAQFTHNLFVGGGTVLGGANASSVTETGDQTLATRAAAGFPAMGLPPMPGACTQPIGNVPVP